MIWLLHYTAQSEVGNLTSHHFFDTTILANYQQEFPKLFKVSKEKFQTYLGEIGLETHSGKVEQLLYTFSLQGHRIL